MDQVLNKEVYKVSNIVKQKSANPQRSPYRHLSRKKGKRGKTTRKYDIHKYSRLYTVFQQI